MLIGFDQIKSNLLTLYQNKKLHHAILLHGKKGIGKASFAQEFVKEVMDSKTTIDPDLLLIEKEEGKKEITVDKIRQISDFNNQTSAISENKFIIIDSACELNKSASNAVLKTLEEPRPHNFLILISHNLNRVLPTIRSRCQIIKIPDFSFENFIQVLHQENPKISASDLKFLSKICDNSPADAIDLGPDLSRFYELFLRSILNKKISDELLKKVSDKNFSFVIFEKIFEFFLNRLLQCLSDTHLDFLSDEQEVFRNLILKFTAQKIFLMADVSLILLHKTTSLHLDKKLTLINIFNQFAIT